MRLTEWELWEQMETVMKWKTLVNIFKKRKVLILLTQDKSKGYTKWITEEIQRILGLHSLRVKKAGTVLGHF